MQLDEVVITHRDFVDVSGAKIDRYEYSNEGIKDPMNAVRFIDNSAFSVYNSAVDLIGAATNLVVHPINSAAVMGEEIQGVANYFNKSTPTKVKNDIFEGVNNAISNVQTYENLAGGLMTGKVLGELSTGSTVNTPSKVAQGTAKVEQVTINTLNDARAYELAMGSTSLEDVTAYISEVGHLPENYITKADAQALGWKPQKGNLDVVAPGKSIGGDIFANKEGMLPQSEGRVWYEADINYTGGRRGSERLLFSNDNLMYIQTIIIKPLLKLDNYEFDN